MKRGRPRKSPDESAGITWSMWQRFRDVSREPKLETPVGRMTFLQEFTQYQWDTIERVQQIYHDFSLCHGLRRYPISPSFEVGIGRSPDFENDTDRDRAEMAKITFDKLQDQTVHFPRDVWAATVEFCVQERACPPGYLPKVRGVLEFLSTVFGYKPRKKRLDKSKAVND